MGLELAKAYVTVQADQTRLKPSLDATQGTILDALGGISGKIAGLISSGLMAGFGVLAAGGAGVGALLTKGIIDSAAVEQTTISLETMLGSAEKAKSLMQQMTSFAAKTPFEMPGITGTSKVLLAFGMQQQEIMPTLKMLGDVAAGTGKDLQELGVIYGQVKAAGRLMGGDMLQLVNAGIPIIGTLAKQFGVAEGEIKKMSEHGKISFADVEKAFQTMSGEGGLFFNMMERQSGTMAGMWSTLQDAVSMFAQKAVAPLLPLVKESLGAMIGYLEQAGEWVGILAQDWSATWDLMKQGAVVALSTIWDYTLDFVRNLPTMLAQPFANLVTFIDSMIRNIGQGVPEAMVQAYEDMMVAQLDAYSNMDFGISEKTQERIDRFKQMAADMASKRVVESTPEVGASIGKAAAETMKENIPDLFGFNSIEDLGRKSQDIALKRDKDSAQSRMVQIAELGIKKQDEMIAAIKANKPAVGAVLS